MQQHLEQAQGTDTASQQVRALQEKAKIDLDTFEKRYSKKQILERERILSNIQQVEQDPTLNRRDKDHAIRALKLKDIGLTPTERQRLSPYPEGQGVGQSYKNALGIPVTRQMNGDERVIDMTKTPEGIAQAHELEATKEAKKLEMAEKKEREKFRQGLFKQQTSDPASPSGKRFLTPDEVQKVYNNAYPPPAPAVEDVAHAQVYIEQMRGRWGASPPPEVKQSMMEAYELIKSSRGR